jgi:hypothetical protein
MVIHEKRIFFVMAILEDQMIVLKKEYFLVYLIRMLICLVMKTVVSVYKNQKNRQQEL